MLVYSTSLPMEHTRFAPEQNPNQYLPTWTHSKEAAAARNQELKRHKDELMQPILGELVVHGTTIDNYDYQLSHNLAFELNRLADVVVRYHHPHLDILEGEDETTRLGRFQLDKTEKLEQIINRYGPEASTILCELYDEFLPVETSDVESSLPEAA